MKPYGRECARASCFSVELMELYTLVNIYAERFIPIFIRVAVMLSFIPFIGARGIPLMARAGLAIALTLLLRPVVTVRVDNPVKAVFEAFLVGAAMGLSMRIILAAIEMAAQWMSIQMGFGMAAVFNPLFGEQLGPLSFFYSILAMSLFFIFDVHFYFIEGIARSFEISVINYNGMAGSILKLNGLLFPLAFKMAAPVMLVLLLVNIAVGFLSRVLPQANLYFVSVPLHIVVGILILVVSLPLTFLVIVKSFSHVKDAMLLFVR